jgi:2-polyprenyl-3-methyl-5-hydroxy-6-metoxy-1,4-benzoquinol methylase
VSCLMKSTYSEFSCDLCGSSDAIEVPHVQKYTNNQLIHICKTCGFVYVKQRRTAQEIADSWSNDLYEKKYTARIPAVKARQVYVAETIDVELGLNNKTLCDIGAGEGQFLEIIKSSDYGAKVFGIEPSEKNCSQLSGLGIANFQGTIEDYANSQGFKENQTDIVTIIWTLENCYSCMDMLKTAHKLLKPGGHIVIATGSRILVPFKKPLDYYLGQNPADTHLFRFSARTLTGLLSESGFRRTYINRYIDSDILCVIGRKESPDLVISWEKDDFRSVEDFFNRWHIESASY